MSKSKGFIFFALSLSFALVGCQTSPTGRSQFVVVPEEQVDQMGVQAFDEMKQKQPINHDPATNAYVKCIANAITSAMGESKPWDVVVFEDKTPNAFALPGGKIGVQTGILPVANTAGQLAAVIGHEVGHVLAQHGRERMSQQLTTQGILGVTSAVLANREGPAYQIGIAALGLGAQYGVLLPFSRAQESEADVIGIDLMAKAGFDPRESVQLWANMGKAGGGQPPQWLSTHPSNETRTANLQSHMNDAIRTQAASGRHPNCVR